MQYHEAGPGTVTTVDSEARRYCGLRRSWTALSLSYYHPSEGPKLTAGSQSQPRVARAGLARPIQSLL